MTYEIPDDEFLRMVQYFYEEKGDPERYSSWDKRRFAALCPEAFRALRRLRWAQRRCDKCMEEIGASNSGGSFDA